jgi:hypothetical protein
MIRTTRGAGDLMEPPLHGNQGDRGAAPGLEAPLGLTVAISRETGARGSSIAQLVGKKLGWQVYPQDLLEFLSSNESARSHVLTDVPKEAAHWAEGQLERLRSERIIRSGVELGEMPRLILTLAARGSAILVGRGAGYFLPRATTLHARVVAPLEDRVAFMAQWLRMSREDAAQQVHERDQKRAEYLLNAFDRRPGEPNDYDMILNSFFLGEEICADMIYAAVNGKQRLLRRDGDV